MLHGTEKFLQSSEDTLCELEELMKTYRSMGESILKRVESLVTQAEKNNSSTIMIPVDVVKLLLSLCAQNTPKTPTFTPAIPSPKKVESNAICDNRSIHESSSKAKRHTFFQSSKSKKKIKEFKSVIDKPPCGSSEDPILEEKIKKRFSLKSKNAIVSLGLSPEFLLYQSIDKFPDIKISPLTVNRALVTMKGPGDSSHSIMNYGNYASATSISNYPKMYLRPYAEGDPICDRFHLSLFENRVVMSLADGCNWGDLPRKAAKRATKSFVRFMTCNHKDIYSIRSAATIVMAAFAEADRMIRRGMDELGPPPGSTTMVAGVLLEINFFNDLSPRSAAKSAVSSNWDGSPWVFVYASIGDCKCYHYSSTSKVLTDLTTSRIDTLDPMNPGGRIGGAQADLGNFTVSYCPCNQDDILILLTDGMYDNFDPIQQGKSPKDFGYNLESWSDMDKTTLREVVDAYIVKFILKELIPEDNNPQLKDIVNNSVNFVSNFTAPSRSFMENNPTSKLPSNLELYPGKLDHATCALVRVGRMTLSYNEWVGKDKPTSQFSTRSRNNNNNSSSNSGSSTVSEISSDPFDRSEDVVTDSDLIGSYQSIRRFTKLFD